MPIKCTMTGGLRLIDFKTEKDFKEENFSLNKLKKDLKKKLKDINDQGSRAQIILETFAQTLPNYDKSKLIEIMKGFLVEDSSLDKSEENSYIPSFLDWSAWEDKSGKYWKYWEGYKEDPIKKSTYEVVKDFNGDYVLHSYQDNNGDWWERYEPLKSYSV